jgi:hypothetical protein
LAYLLSHWRGRLPLGVSLWVNTIGLLFVISYTELFVLSKLLINPSRLIGLTLLSLLVTRVIIFIWQLTGLFRAIEHDFAAHGNILKTRVLQALAMLTVVFTLTYSLDVLQGAVFYTRQVEIHALPSARPAYQLELNALEENHQQQLTIRGGLDIGITSAVRSILKTNPRLSSIVLQSRGGQIYEGRGLARLFTEYGIDTYVYDECSSACTTAFIGGKTRYLFATGKLGFHQYKVMKKHRLFAVYYDVRIEQERDLALFKSRGVEQAFLDKIFDQPANRIWFPNHSTLLDARVVHFTLDGSD